MSDEAEPDNQTDGTALSEERQRIAEVVTKQEERKLRARREGDRGIWFGLGMYGLIGWSVAIPTVIGIAAGVWLDARFDMGFSWTLTLLFVGLTTGCINAWYWLKREGHID